MIPTHTAIEGLQGEMNGTRDGITTIIDITASEGMKGTHLLEIYS
jgi:hypothetical protein